MNNNEVDTIKKRVPLLYLIDEAIEQETNISYAKLYAKRGGTNFTSLCRLIYANIATLATWRLTIRDIAIVLNVSETQVSLYKKKIIGLLQTDSLFRELYDKIYSKFNQLKNEKENGMD